MWSSQPWSSVRAALRSTSRPLSENDADMFNKSLSDAMLEFARTMASDYLAITALNDLMVQASEGLSVDGAGIMLSDDKDDLRFVAASDDRVRDIEQMQVDSEEGPCVLAARTGEIIITDDLRSGDDRFPRFAEAAVEIGMLSVHSFPMQIEDVTIGAMNLYRNRAGRLSEAEQEAGKVFSDMSSLYLFNARRIDEATDMISGLRQALDRNAPIEQAKGYVAGVRHIETGQAYDLIRTFARRNRQRVLDVSAQLIGGTLSIASLEAVD